LFYWLGKYIEIIEKLQNDYFGHKKTTLKAWF